MEINIKYIYNTSTNMCIYTLKTEYMYLFEIFDILDEEFNIYVYN